MFTPMKEHLLVEDREEVRTVRGVALPDPSTGHQGVVKGMCPFKVGIVRAVGSMPPEFAADAPEALVDILYSNTAGRIFEEREVGDPISRIIHISEIQLVLEDYNHDTDRVNFI